METNKYKIENQDKFIDMLIALRSSLCQSSSVYLSEIGELLGSIMEDYIKE